MSNKFIEIATANITPKRSIVISKLNKPDEGSVIIGQRLTVKDDNDKMLNVFLKGALNIPKDSLYDLRDALNEAIKYFEKK